MWCDERTVDEALIGLRLVADRGLQFLKHGSKHTEHGDLVHPLKGNVEASSHQLSTLTFPIELPIKTPTAPKRISDTREP